MRRWNLSYLEEWGRKQATFQSKTKIRSVNVPEKLINSAIAGQDIIRGVRWRRKLNHTTGSLSKRVLRRGRQPEENISRARKVLSPICLYYSSLMEKIAIIYVNVVVWGQVKSGNSSLPVAVRVSKTCVLNGRRHQDSGDNWMRHWNLGGKNQTWTTKLLSKLFPACSVPPPPLRGKAGGGLSTATGGPTFLLNIFAIRRMTWRNIYDVNRCSDISDSSSDFCCFFLSRLLLYYLRTRHVLVSNSIEPTRFQAVSPSPSLLTYCAISAAKTPPRRHPHRPHLWSSTAAGLTDVSEDDVRSRQVLSESDVLRTVSRDSAHHL